MIRLRTLRARLTVSFALTLVGALIVFAGTTLVLVRQNRLTTLDERLDTAARASIAVPSAPGDRLVVTAAARKRFARIVGPRLDGAIVTTRGAVLATTAVTVPAELVALARTHRGATTLLTLRPRDAPGSEIRLAATAVPSLARPLGIVVVWRTIDPFGVTFRRLATLFALTIPVVGLLAIAAASIVAGRGLAPLERLAALASEIEATDLSRRIGPHRDDDEVGRLCAVFDRMLGRLEAAFARQRRLAGDASHELRTPLSVIRAEAELALRHPRERAEYRRALEVIAQHADALDRIAQDLLALVRADDGADGADRRVFPLSDAARNVVAGLRPLAAAEGVAIVVDPDDQALVNGSPIALERALACVVHNAITYSPSGGVVAVEVGRAGSSAVLRVTDDGPGFSPAALAHAVERFWREQPGTRGRRALGSGNGLGLAIAAAAARADGGELRLANGPGGGAAVLFRFPLAGSRSSAVQDRAPAWRGGVRTT